MFSNLKNRSPESGNAGIIVLVVIAVLAVAGLTFYATQMKGQGSDSVSTAESSTSNGENTAQSDFVIKPGNPVVAKIGEQEITRLDVFNFIQTLPPETRQVPTEQLFPAALEQVINDRVISSKTEGANLDNDPEVKRQVAELKKNIVRNVYVQKQIDARLTDERIDEAYEQYKANFPEIYEAKARHILVKDESLAKDLIAQIENGADFAQLAQENSTDGTAENGGEVGYFAENEVVPEFAKAAFDLEVGEVTDKPVETQFGYHVIKLEEKRQRPPAALPQVKPFIEAQLRRVLLDEVIRDWRSASEIERFDINGEPPKAAASSEG